MKTSLYHKLLHVRLSKALNEELTLTQEGVKENGRCLCTPAAWRVVLDAGFLRVCPIQPHFLRRICLAAELLNEPVARPKIDKAALKKLMDMGFPEARAKKALVLNKMAVMAAMDWLFQNENDPDIDSPLPELEAESPSAALQRLIEMGFEESEATDALRMFRNDQDAACDWLLGDRKERAAVVEEGLDPSSAVYQAIMENPTVQLGLNNPRSLLAFLQMLENPLAANQWLNDPETGPILMQVSRIYQMRLDGERVPSTAAASSTVTVAPASSTVTVAPASSTVTVAPASSTAPSPSTATSSVGTTSHHMK
nr:hypothetical protein BaRGS_002410 [Batillaria attramentaria]